MDKPLSNLDYLIKRDNQPSQQQQRPLSNSRNVDAPPPVDPDIEEAVVLLASRVLQALHKRNDRCTVFELVDDLGIRVNDLRPVLDQMADRYRWIDLQHVDLKGDDPMALTDRGRAQLERYSVR